MSRAFECAMSLPGRRLETDEDDIDLPTLCPWYLGENSPKWTEAES